DLRERGDGILSRPGEAKPESFFMQPIGGGAKTRVVQARGEKTAACGLAFDGKGWDGFSDP
ncbi:MAG: hypothetical protein LBF93_03400, partial [Zoogloeaceae bacterium]|nr:hypothetical protein [Zoogloeaceae bacterium]